MAKNDDYNPEDDPQYAIDKANTERAYWQMRRKSQGISSLSVGSVGWPRRQHRDMIPNTHIFGTPDYLPSEAILNTRVAKELKLRRQYTEFMLMAYMIDVDTAMADTRSKKRALEEVMGRETREMSDLQVGRIFREIYQKAQEFLKQESDEVPF